MVKSMTGYGRARETRSGRDITVEVRSVNNRYLDCTVKMPRAYIFAEDAVKARVQKAVSRGKVDVFITIDTSAADEAVVKLNRPLAQGYYKALCEINEACGLESEITASTIARFPDVLTVTKAEEDLESVAVDLCAVLDDALAAYNRMRATEGERLAADIGSRLDTIEHITGMVEERSPQTVAEYRARLTAKMEEVLQSTTIDEARILTEAAIFADGPQDGLPHSGGQPREQYHRLQVQRYYHRARCGRPEGGGRKDPRAGAEHRVRRGR